MISADGNKLIIGEISTPKGTIQSCDIDMIPYQGQLVRMYLDNNLNIVINPNYDCYWQIAEVRVPYQLRDAETDEILPLDLSNAELIEYKLPV